MDVEVPAPWHGRNGFLTYAELYTAMYPNHMEKLTHARNTSCGYLQVIVRRVDDRHTLVKKPRRSTVLPVFFCWWDNILSRNRSEKKKKTSCPTASNYMCLSRLSHNPKRRVPNLWHLNMRGDLIDLLGNDVLDLRILLFAL